LTTDFSFLNAGEVTASLVVDEGGNSITAEGNSRGIGNANDLEFLLWLRTRSQIVLTSGITAEAENYKYPAKSDLAILSNSNRNYPRLEQSLDKVRFISNTSFSEAVRKLQEQGFERIQTEFGETGFQALACDQIDCFLSSKSRAGIKQFLQRTELVAEETFDLSELQIARVVGRGRD
jgi:riboflavin biosynthesis pyrimidine reductase